MGDEDDVVEMRKDKEMAAIGNWMKWRGNPEWRGNSDLAIRDQFAHCLSATTLPSVITEGEYWAHPPTGGRLGRPEQLGRHTLLHSRTGSSRVAMLSYRS